MGTERPWLEHLTGEGIVIVPLVPLIWTMSEGSAVYRGVWEWVVVVVSQWVRNLDCWVLAGTPNEPHTFSLPYTATSLSGNTSTS